ncbi:MAG: hypothetical protein PHC75_05195 [Burkholderiales bacterium]|nr:hypothetical protein [Burkholderiales bacterium]
MGLDIILMVLGLLLICSFFYNFLLDKFQIPSVLLLIFTGIILKILIKLTGLAFIIPQNILPLFGTLGLITIVLEAVLDLKITSSNYKLVILAFLNGTFSIIITILLIGFLIFSIYPVNYQIAMIYATPLAIVSSAIVIPSITRLTSDQKEFLVFESISSDIIGVLIFNFLITVKLDSWSSISTFPLSLLWMVSLSALISIPLILTMHHSKRNHQHIFILAILIFMYGVAKHYHLSALILILIFGFFLNNIHLILERTKFKDYFNRQIMTDELSDLQRLTGEFAFILRTFFFILLGYSVEMNGLFSFKALLLGGAILLLIYVIRFVVFKMFKTNNLLLNSLVAPRGLITLLLFSQIPENLKFNDFDHGVIFLAVILSSLVMSVKLVYQKYAK